ncbi:hypothetical protein Q7P37_004938 [Cladosporium fusiforme]
MAPIIHCVRHAQGFHNVGGGDYTLRDPCLTPLGEGQCEVLRTASFLDQSEISLVAASPLCRTLHTAFLTFNPALMSTSKCQPQILALPEAQEISSDRCDTGSDPAVLREIVDKNYWPVDLSLVEDGWNVKGPGSRYGPDHKAIKARAKDTRVILRQKIRELVQTGDTDAKIVLVTHGGFLHYFTDDWEEPSRNPGTGWQNCETRSYAFEADLMTGEDEEAKLVETLDSRRKRGKVYPMFGHQNQSELFDLAMQSWEDQGLQRPDSVDMTPSPCTFV